MDFLFWIFKSWQDDCSKLVDALLIICKFMKWWRHKVLNPKCDVATAPCIIKSATRCQTCTTRLRGDKSVNSFLVNMSGTVWPSHLHAFLGEPSALFLQNDTAFEARCGFYNSKALKYQFSTLIFDEGFVTTVLKVAVKKVLWLRGRGSIISAKRRFQWYMAYMMLGSILNQ